MSDNIDYDYSDLSEDQLRGTLAGLQILKPVSTGLSARRKPSICARTTRPWMRRRPCSTGWRRRP